MSLSAYGSDELARHIAPYSSFAPACGLIALWHVWAAELPSKHLLVASVALQSPDVPRHVRQGRSKSEVL